jgi:hypothetical protein
MEIREYLAQTEKLSDGVYFDSVNGVAGTAWPIGTPEKPVNNLTELLVILAARKLDKVVLRNDATVLQFTGALADIIFVGEGEAGALSPTVDFNGQAITCTFINLRITDTAGDNLVSASEFRDCHILKVIAHTVGGATYRKCVFGLLYGTVTNPPLGIIKLYDDCVFLGTLANTTGTVLGWGDQRISCNLTNTTGTIEIYGDVYADNFSQAGAGKTYIYGDLHAHSGFSHSGGDVYIYGNCYIASNLTNITGNTEIHGNCHVGWIMSNTTGAIKVYGNCHLGYNLNQTAAGLIEIGGNFHVGQIMGELSNTAGTLRVAGKCHVGRGLYNYAAGHIEIAGDCIVGYEMSNEHVITLCNIRFTQPNPTMDLSLAASSKTERVVSRGSLTVTRMVAGATAIIDLCSGTLTIANSCTGGTITLYGDCALVDLAAGAVTINDHRTNQKDTRFFQEVVAATDVNGTTWKDLLDRSVITKPVRICGFMVTKGGVWAGFVQVRIVDGAGTTKIFPFKTEYEEPGDFALATQATLNFPVEVSVSKGYKFQFRSTNAGDGAGETLALDNLDVQELS